MYLHLLIALRKSVNPCHELRVSKLVDLSVCIIEYLCHMLNLQKVGVSPNADMFRKC